MDKQLERRIYRAARRLFKLKHGATHHAYECLMTFWRGSTHSDRPAYEHAALVVVNLTNRPRERHVWMDICADLVAHAMENGRAVQPVALFECTLCGHSFASSGDADDDRVTMKAHSKLKHPETVE